MGFLLNAIIRSIVIYFFVIWSLVENCLIGFHTTSFFFLDSQVFSEIQRENYVMMTILATKLFIYSYRQQKKRYAHHLYKTRMCP